jgi:hypothetical protein
MSQTTPTAQAEVDPAIRQTMIEVFTGNVGDHAAGYDIPALVDDLISKGYTDLDDVEMTPFMAACRRHQNRVYWGV